jgi:hypothetical protein
VPEVDWPGVAIVVWASDDMAVGAVIAVATASIPANFINVFIVDSLLAEPIVDAPLSPAPCSAGSFFFARRDHNRQIRTPLEIYPMTYV